MDWVDVITKLSDVLTCVAVRVGNTLQEAIDLRRGYSDWNPIFFCYSWILSQLARGTSPTASAWLRQNEKRIQIRIYWFGVDVCTAKEWKERHCIDPAKVPFIALYSTQHSFLSNVMHFVCLSTSPPQHSQFGTKSTSPKLCYKQCLLPWHEAWRQTRLKGTTKSRWRRARPWVQEFHLGSITEITEMGHTHHVLEKLELRAAIFLPTQPESIGVVLRSVIFTVVIMINLPISPMTTEKMCSY